MIEDSDLNREYERILEALEYAEPGSEEYNELLHHMSTLLKMSKDMKPETALDKVLRNATLVNLLGQFGLAFILMSHERTHVLTSRVGGWIRTRF